MQKGKRLIDANAMREDWLENGENEYVYDTNVVLDSIDAQPTVDAVVLPCKIGDTLYDIYEAVGNGGDEIKEYNVSTIEIKITKNGRAFLLIENVMFQFDDFGKTIFLTQEEAKAALAKMGSDGKGNES